jgi:hypothetical protein
MNSKKVLAIGLAALLLLTTINYYLLAAKIVIRVKGTGISHATKNPDGSIEVTLCDASNDKTCEAEIELEF